MCEHAALLVDHVIPDVPIRQWVVSLPFQIRYLLAADPNFFFRSFENKVFEMGLSPEHLFFRFIEQQASLMNWIVVSLIIAFAFAFGYVGLKLSHRIAGPLFRLEQNMNDLAEGRSVEELTFREGDFFQPLAQSFNKMRKTNR